MNLHHSWWRAILDEPALIPLPLGPDGVPALHDYPIPDEGSPDQWLLLAPAEVRLCPDFAAILRRHIDARPDVGIFYADEVEHSRFPGARVHLKPAMNLALLLACDYIGSPVIVSLAVYRRLAGFRGDCGSATVYDFLLRAHRAGVGIERIAQIMVAHRAARPGSRREDRAAAVRRWIGAGGDALEVAAGLTSESLQVRRRFEVFPQVTLVIPTCQAVQKHSDGPGFARPHICNLLDGIANTDWPMDRLQVLVGDDSPEASTYRQRSYPFRIRRIETQRAPGEPFNYAAKMNRLWRLADSELLVLMNDDIVVEEPGWLRALMGFAMDDTVGGVGARLVFADGRLQHAGMPGGLTDVTSHAWIFQHAGAGTYEDWALMHREWSMVTGAVFATRRAVLEQVNGFDECFSLEYNDVDLCLRIRLLGLRIVYTPFAELLHYEKASRGSTPPRPDQVARFVMRWNELLADDPAFNPGFDMGNVCLTPAAPANPWYEQ